MSENNSCKFMLQLATFRVFASFLSSYDYLLSNCTRTIIFACNQQVHAYLYV